MARLEEFETVLKDLVEAKRLSASKMGKIQDIALKSMEDDTHLVSILYRTHKSLPAGSKVSSLYVFDALARAARSQVTKHGLTGDINSKPGNCATFLLKIEGVLDGLFSDMVMNGGLEGKEKSKKIVDIWVKGSTFPAATLSRLSEIVKDEKVPEPKVPTTTDPRQAVSVPTPAAAPPPPTPVAPTPPLADAQAALLALLSKAVATQPTPTGQTPSNITASTPQLDPAQQALLQQLSQTAKLSGGASLPLPGLVPPLSQPRPPPYIQPPPNGHNSRPPPPFQRGEYERDRRDYDSGGRRDPRPHDYDRPEYDRHNDDRGPPRGGYRGRGRGGRDGGFGREDRDRRWDGPPNRRRSRSRSPPSSRYQYRREVKPYSPPRRPTYSAYGGESKPREPDVPPIDDGKDEFGRDRRPDAEDEVPTPPAKSPTPPTPSAKSVPSTGALSPVVAPPSIPILDAQPATSSIPTHTPTPSLPLQRGPAYPQIPQHPVPQQTPKQTGSAIPVVTSQNEVGLDDFNIATFDFTSPSSWETLGNMWRFTYGETPSTEQLMQFVMTMGMGTTQPDAAGGNSNSNFQQGGQDYAPNAQQQPSDHQYQDWNKQGYDSQSYGMEGATSGRGSYRGRGGYRGFGQRGGRGGGYGHQSYHRGNMSMETDATVLGGGENMDDANYEVPSVDMSIQ